MAIKICTAVTSDFSMNYFRFGGGSKVLVILPGLSLQSVMGSADAVAEAYSIFNEDYTVYLFDRRKELPDCYSISDMADDTFRAIRAAGIDTFDLFGTSQGGMIAQLIALDHPEAVSKLILGSSTPCVTDLMRSSVGEWLKIAKSGDAVSLYRSFSEKVYPPAVFEQYRDVLMQAASAVTDEDLSRFLILAGSSEDFDVRDRLKSLSCPLLAICSSDDSVLGGGTAELFSSIFSGRPDFECYEYDGYGHAAYDLASDYKERMLRFLRK